VTDEQKGIQRQLRQLYQRKWRYFKPHYCQLRRAGGGKLSNPIFIDLRPTTYPDCRIKLLIVGQQTSTWYNHVNAITVANPVGKLLDCYAEFNLGWKNKSPFWNLARRIDKLINRKKDGENGFVHTNLIKFDRAGNRLDTESEEVASTHFNLLPSEISILNPQATVFFTGPQYDERLEKSFPGLVKHPVRGYPLSVVTRLEHPILPVQSYRTYHPKYLTLSGQRGIIDALARRIRRGQLST
jgi:hypothetical protein